MLRILAWKGDLVPRLRCSVVTEFMIRNLGLEICADTIIGNAMVRGVSGGQKKRVTTGAPPFLFVGCASLPPGCLHTIVWPFHHAASMHGSAPSGACPALLSQLCPGCQSHHVAHWSICACSMHGLWRCCRSQLDHSCSRVLVVHAHAHFPGEMIVGPQRVLFMDEISTGLDSSTTFEIVRYLRNATHALRYTTAVALLQPAPEVYDLFDDVLLLAEGAAPFLPCCYPQPTLCYVAPPTLCLPAVHRVGPAPCQHEPHSPCNTDLACYDKGINRFAASFGRLAQVCAQKWLLPKRVTRGILPGQGTWCTTARASRCWTSSSRWASAAPSARASQTSCRRCRPGMHVPVALALAALCSCMSVRVHADACAWCMRIAAVCLLSGVHAEVAATHARLPR